MKLKDCKDWKSVRLDDRTILKADLPILSSDQRKRLETLDVKKTRGKGSYKAIK